MLACGINFDTTVDVSYDLSSIHGNDSRPGICRMRLCISNLYEKESPWFHNAAASNHGRIDNVPLIAVRDMKLPAHANPAYAVEFLSPPERLAQQGSAACEKLLHHLLHGRQSTVRNNQRRVY